MSERLPDSGSILIVDDTVENLRLLSSLLTEHGYEVRPVTSARQALQALDRAPPYHSTGLGLAFCKLAVEAHGGVITVQNGDPVGSVFAFELPV